MVNCTIKECTSKSRNKSSEHLAFHVFPQDIEIKNQWIESIKSYDNDWEFTTECRVCSRHFSEECFDRTSTLLNKLKKDAVPTVFTPTAAQLRQEIKLKGGNWCAASNCSSNSLQNKDLSFFRFPKDEKIRKIWIQNCKRPDLLSKNPHYLYQNRRLCSLHFEDIMFKNQYRTRLLPQAFPTLFNNTKKNPYIIQPVKIVKLNDDSETEDGDVSSDLDAQIIQLPRDDETEREDDYLLVEIKDEKVENIENPWRRKRKTSIEEVLIDDENVTKRTKPTILKCTNPKSEELGNSELIILDDKLISNDTEEEIDILEENNETSDSIENPDSKVDYIIIQHPSDKKSASQDPNQEILNFKIQPLVSTPQVGRRITDIHYFFNSLLDIFQHNMTYRCPLRSLNLELNEDEDFNSYVIIKCTNCGKCFKKSVSDPTNKLLPDVNKSIVEAALGTNLRYYTINNLFYFMCLPTMTEDKFNEIKSEINKTKCKNYE